MSVRLSWSCEAAFWTLVQAPELAAFSVTFNLDFSAAWAEKFCGFAARRNWFAAACTGNQRQR